MSTERQIAHVTCLGCGCGCDDVTITVADDRIVGATPVCHLGEAWFGNGQVPQAIVTDGRPATLEQALASAAAELLGKGPVLVYLAPDLTAQAQRAALAIADSLKAFADTATSDTAAGGLLAAQRRGRAGATLGELRNRGDVFLFWGVDPAARYPRFLARYGPDPVGTHVPGGRSGRLVMSVSIGRDTGLPGADLTRALNPEEEIVALSVMRALVSGQKVPDSRVAAISAEIVARLVQAKYAVLVHDAEPTAERRDPLRAEALIALAQALNGPTRAALCTLRAGGNRVGAEAVMTWQTGYPFAADYSPGYPRYGPGHRGLSRLISGAYRAALVVGTPSVDESAQEALSRIRAVAIGPRASEAAFQTAVAIDTGIAGIHEGGVAYRMDEVPLALRPPLEGGRSTTEVLGALHGVIQSQLGGRTR